MGLIAGIFWILFITNIEKTFAQTRKSSRIISSRSFGLNTKSSSLNGVDFDCPEEFGYYPHPTDCTQYYVCVFGGALLESCTGGLMYSHELQTCDWPRNVGCEVSEINSSPPTSSKDISPRVPQTKQQQQQQQQHVQVPQRVRFSSLSSAPLQQHQSQTPQPRQQQQQQQQQNRQQQIIQAQIQAIPPPPALRVAPNPVITSRGQPKPISLDSREEIAKLYAEAHDTLPPAEEEETDRQQRVYRGQPSTVSQVQRDRDGIIHQANVNAIPNHGKVGSYAFGSQVNQFSYLNNLKTKTNRIKRETKNEDITEGTASNNRTSKENVARQPRQIRIHLNGRSSLEYKKNNLRHDYRPQSNKLRPNLRNEEFNPFLHSLAITSNNYHKNGFNGYKSNQPFFSSLLSDNRNLNSNSPFKPIISETDYWYKEPFRPYVTTTTPSTTPPALIFPFLFEELKNAQSPKKPHADTLPDNFSYFHFGDGPSSVFNTHPRPSTEVNKATTKNHPSTAFSTIGGFYNNHEKDSLIIPNSYDKNIKFSQQLNIPEPPLQVTTESNYFAYNILQNQKMNNFYLTSTIRPTTTEALGYQPFHTDNFYVNAVVSNFSSPVNLNKFNVSLLAKNQSIQQNLNASNAYTVKTTRPLMNTKTIVHKNQTILPHPLLELNLDFNKFIKGIAQSQIVQTDPSIMEMLNYFKSSTNTVKNYKTINNSSPLTLSIFPKDFEKQTGSNNYTNRTIRPANDKSNLNSSRTYSSVQKLTPIKTSKIKLEYIPTSLNYDDSEEYYDDDDDYDINPPSEKPLYMPNSETMAPKPYPTLTTPKSAMFTTKKPFSYFHNDSNTDKIPSIIDFPPDIFENMKSIFQHNTSTVRPFDNFLTKFATQKSIISTSLPTTIKTIQTGLPNRGHLKWKINKMTSKQNESNRPVQQLEVGEKKSHRVETSSQSPGNAFVQQRPSKTATEQNTRNYYNNTNHQQPFRSSPYDSYYSVYDDDVELYRDVEFSSEHQQQRGKSQSSTYRPEPVTTPAPLVPGRDTYNKPQTKQQYEQPSLVYNTDYDDTIISQLEDDDYNQPTRNPLRDDRIEINSIMNRPVVISRTTDEPPYTPTLTLSPISYAQIPQSPKSQSPPIQQQQQQKVQQQQSKQPQRISQHSKYIQSHPIDQYNVVSTPTPDYPNKQTTPSRSTLSDIGSNNKTSKLISITQSAIAGSSKFEDSDKIHQSIEPLPIPTILKESQFQNSQFQNHSNTFMTEKQLLVSTPFTNYTNDKLTSYDKINSISSSENISVSSNNLVSEDNKDKDQIINRQSERILSYIVSDVQPQSFKLARKRITEKLPSTETNPLKLASVRSNTLQLKSRNGLSHNRAVIEPTTYSPPKTWRLTGTIPSPFEALNGNPLKKSFRNQNTSLSDNIKNESINEQVSSLESENYATKEKIQSYTTRALVFKDNLNKNFDTTGSPKYVSPYKSLETILQDEHLTTVKPRYTTLPPLTTTPQKPFRSYFLITAPPKNNNISITSTTTPTTTTVSSKLENVSDIVTTSSSVITTKPTTMSIISIPTNKIYEPNVSSTLSTIADVRRTTPTSSSSTKLTLKIRTTPVPSTITKFLNKKDSDNHENTFRGRLKYTFSYTDNSLDEPTTYSPKIRYSSSNYNSITTTPEPIFKRKNVRIRPTPVIFSNSSYNKEIGISKPEFSALKSPKQEEDFESPRNYFTKTDKSYQFSHENESSNFQNLKSETVEEVSSTSPTTEEIVVEITERPLYRIIKPPEYLIKEKIVDDSVVNVTQNQLQENLRILKTNIQVEPVLNLEYDETTKESEYSTELSAATSTENAQSIAMLEILKSNNTTTITNDISTTTEKTLTTTTGIAIQTVTKSTVSYPKLLLPSRVSRVNNAIKTSIAASSRTKTTTTAILKCADNTPNTKCNEIPSRQNNRNRGGSHYSSSDRDQPVTVPVNRGTHPPRIRPTLKPSGTIVSKASEFIDIYRNPALRPEPLYPQPTPDKTAAKCRKDVCLLPDCYCGGKDIPGDLPVENVPQIVLLTFDDSVNDLNKQLYIDLFEKGRVNPNGCPITATFYVSHEWTDYSQVQNLYADGHEMASHTVSHSFGEQFSQKKWTREVAGQREILAAYGGVKLSDVRGMRAPFLSIGGNKMFKMLYDSNFTYDSSMPVYENRPPSWPYTLDYKIFHDCMIPPCPTKSYPGVWEVPMVMWQDLNGGRCSMGDACSNPADAENVYKMIMKNFERHYTTNRAPFGLFYHAAWFTQPHHKEGFISFLDTINAMNDVWIVTNWQALQWVRDPTPLSRINQFQPFQCDYSDRPKRCNNPKVCNLWHKSGVRYMRTCQPCPDIYPWTGKTGIRSSRIDNDIEE